MPGYNTFLYSLPLNYHNKKVIRMDFGLLGGQLSGLLNNPEGKEMVKKFLSSPEGMAVIKEYLLSPQGKEIVISVLPQILESMNLPPEAKTMISEYIK